MSVTLLHELQQFIHEPLAEGRFNSEEEIISEGLRLLQRREELSALSEQGFKKQNKAK
ncbi:MAG: type II toxin-antitoxin system ParD family antitoxin [Planctomycetota bacterium]|jgi:putative addiction module CopG family antidote|nr:type II toxin-antitoxin system ParD family antitoxin [Planctomycetota bacterium]MDP7248338.1 type II toxin-antitoxin system ParD family antitoxin [Planctomycetota bacterium]